MHSLRNMIRELVQYIQQLTIQCLFKEFLGRQCLPEGPREVFLNDFNFSQ